MGVESRTVSRKGLRGSPGDRESQPEIHTKKCSLSVIHSLLILSLGSRSMLGGGEGSSLLFLPLLHLFHPSNQ